MKKTITFTMAALTLLALSIMSCKNSSVAQNTSNTISPKCTIDTVRELQIIFADSIDGIPTYSVLFPDSTALDFMYPEEIAHGLSTGEWKYNEDLEFNKRDTK